MRVVTDWPNAWRLETCDAKVLQMIEDANQIQRNIIVRMMGSTKRKSQ
jgi:hypothetical protein